MRVGIVGCGMMGARRAAVVREFDGDQVTMVADVETQRAAALAAGLRCAATTAWEAVVDSDVDAVIVATSNDWLAPITLAALRRGKHVLVEKPMGRTVEEALAVHQAAREQPVVVQVGFTLRHHPAVQQARALCADGAIGDLLYARGRYGHGGRPGYDREWRARRSVAGGGEMLDQGIHLVDLCRWFLGEFTQVFGMTASYAWGPLPHLVHADPSTPPQEAVEDNAFALLRTPRGQVASVHASWTQWKNLFAFEVFGERGYVIIEGLGGSYGPERLIVGRRRPDQDAPDETTQEFEGAQAAWRREWEEFRTAVAQGRPPLPNSADGWQAWRLVDAVYASARSGKAVAL